MTAMEWVPTAVSCVALLTAIGSATMAWQKYKDKTDEHRRRIEALEEFVKVAANRDSKVDISINENRRSIEDLEGLDRANAQLDRKLAVLANDLEWVHKLIMRHRGSDRTDQPDRLPPSSVG